MDELRVYDQKKLIELAKEPGGISELKHKLAMVEGSNDLTPEEKDKNVEIINFAITGERDVNEQVIKDIEAGKADTDDMDGKGRG